MPIELPKETRLRLLESIKRFSSEHLEQEIGDLKATLVLDFCLQEIGPSVYNQAVGDAQRHLVDRVEEMGGAVHQQEFAYWRR